MKATDAILLVDALVRERDEARKLYAEAWSAEHEDASPFGARIVAGRRWGRTVALELYPDDDLRAWLLSDGGYIDDDDEGRDLEERIAFERASFDCEVPT